MLLRTPTTSSEVGLCFDDDRNELKYAPLVA